VGEHAQIFEGHDRWLQNLWIFREFLTIFPTLVSYNWSHPADSDRCCIFDNNWQVFRKFITPLCILRRLRSFDDLQDTHRLQPRCMRMWMYWCWSNWARRCECIGTGATGRSVDDHRGHHCRAAYYLVARSEFLCSMRTRDFFWRCETGTSKEPPQW